MLDLLLKLRNVSRVADTLSLTQSAVSNSLARLRSHFDDDLLVQSGREMVATPLALQMAESIEELVCRARAIALTRAEFKPGSSEQDFSVVASDYAATLLFPDLVKRIGLVAPQVSIFQVPMPDLASEHAFDILIGSNVAFDSAVCTTPLWEEHFVPVVWAGNTDVPERVSLAAIQQFTHISAAFDERLSVRIVDHFLQSKGVRRTKTIRLQSLLLLPEFLVGTPNMAILPRRLALLRAQDLPLRILQFDFAFPTITERLQWPVYLDRDPANIWLRELIKASVADAEARWSELTTSERWTEASSLIDS